MSQRLSKARKIVIERMKGFEKRQAQRSADRIADNRFRYGPPRYELTELGRAALAESDEQVVETSN